MFCVFCINNIELGENFVGAGNIADYLLSKNLWAFSATAPNLKYFNEGDRAVVYLAGKENRFFTADFAIVSKPYEAEKNSQEPDWLAMFPNRVKIENINIWKEPLPIRDVIDKLDFIKDKKNYGLYFRQSTKIIEEKDFYTIVAKY